MYKLNFFKEHMLKLSRYLVSNESGFLYLYDERAFYESNKFNVHEATCGIATEKRLFSTCRSVYPRKYTDSIKVPLLI